MKADGWSAVRNSGLYRPKPEDIAASLAAEAKSLRNCTWSGDLSPSTARTAEAAAIRALIADNERLRADNERLRWRHRDTLPEWNDLPDKLRTALVRIGEQMIDPHSGGDAMVAIWKELRKELQA